MCQPANGWKEIKINRQNKNSLAIIIATRSDNQIFRLELEVRNNSTNIEDLVDAITKLEEYRTCSCPFDVGCHKPNSIRRA